MWTFPNVTGFYLYSVMFSYIVSQIYIYLYIFWWLVDLAFTFLFVYTYLEISHLYHRYPLYPNSTLLSTSTPWLVQCDRFTKISIQWSGETIRVLSGGKSQQQTVMYVQEDGMLDINTVSFGAPSSATAAADWRFPRHMGRYYRKTRGSSTRNFGGRRSGEPKFNTKTEVEGFSLIF